MHDLNDYDLKSSSSSTTTTKISTTAISKSSIIINNDKLIDGMDPDPRVQVELENLNTSTEFINKLELELEKARLEFNDLLAESAVKIESLSKKLGTSIHKARPYYEARQTANELHQKAQKEALRYEQATVEHNNAKEIVQLAEQTLRQNGDIELEQLLTKSAEKVNQSELERQAAEKQHRFTSREYSLTEQNLSKLHNQLKRSIVKASMETRRNFLELNNYANQHRLQLLPYFEMKAQFNQMLEEQVNKIRSYETRVNKAKQNYTKALQRLEELNNKIYDQRLPPTDGVQNLADNHNDDDGGGGNHYNEIVEETKTNIEKNINNEDEQKYLKPSNKSNQEYHDETIFDNEILDQLILEDDLDDNLNRLKIECLNLDHHHHQQQQQQVAQKSKETSSSSFSE
ncbi:SH3 domain-binding protein 5-like [Dermatophagoides farinae]|uniref:SH3 domain-binding protein 5-like n=1 Tax=Dermatophagoides farinae TaxID=6954 RepID=A0A922HW96_DERFA|nr:SH3 domain-binding protein 5-like isoform X1 [Dermatophagoides farinae]KAH7643165.1 sh3 domain-binding protein 5-like [Dermatophagoides farinae]KAH9512102.1 SH3 domain-binding protein 5-like [Dermatophagoides farinae]